MKIKVLLTLSVSIGLMLSCSIDDQKEQLETINRNKKANNLNLIVLNYNESLSCNNADLTYSESYYKSDSIQNHYSMLLDWNINVDLSGFSSLFYLQIKELPSGIINSQPLPASGPVLISHHTYQWPTTITPSEIVSYKHFEYRFVYNYFDAGQLCVSETGWKYFNLIQ